MRKRCDDVNADLCWKNECTGSVCSKSRLILAWATTGSLVRGTATPSRRTETGRAATPNTSTRHVALSPAAAGKTCHAAPTATSPARKKQVSHSVISIAALTFLRKTQ